MKRHFLSAAAIGVAVLFGAATSFFTPVHPRIERTEEGLLITNTDEFEWTELSVVLLDSYDPPRVDSFRAQTKGIAPGETVHFPFSEIVNESFTPYSFERFGDMVVIIDCEIESGQQAVARGPALTITQLPLVATPTRP